jgi:DNA-binding NarL/FixJ family response regulator
MNYKVLIYSVQPIIEVGLSFCLKKSIPNATILNTNSLIFLSVNEPKFNCDLFVFDISHHSELELIISHFASFFDGKKVVFFIENLEMVQNQDLKSALYIYKNSSEVEIVKSLNTFCNIPKWSLRYRSITKNIQNKNKLSEREKQCANLLMKGYTVTQISKELSLKKNTISTYKMRMHKKTNTKNLVQLIKTLYFLND